MLLKNASVLIIDDDTDVLTAVRLLLKTESKEVITEKNPENLRSLLAKQPFDVILLDMNFTSSINTGNEGLVLAKKNKGIEIRSRGYYDHGLWRYRSGRSVIKRRCR